MYSKMSNEELVAVVNECHALLDDALAGERAYFALAIKCYGLMVTVRNGCPPAVPDYSTWNGQDARLRIEAFLFHASKELARRLSTQGDVEGLVNRAEHAERRADDLQAQLIASELRCQALRREKAEDEEGLAKQVVEFAKSHCDFVASGEPSCMEYERGVNECDLCRAADLFRMSHEEALAFKRLTQGKRT